MEDDAPGPEDADENQEGDPGGSMNEREAMRESQMKIAGTKDRGPGGLPEGITPAAKRANWAHSYMIQNSITLA